MLFENFYSILKRYQRVIFLVLTITAGMILLYPHHDFQGMLSQGDHGRDLYAFKKVYEGAIPYRDFYTKNGPLMPYYYSLCFHLFGMSIQSVVLGFNVLVFFMGMGIFSVCSIFLSPAFSFLASLWYWTFRGPEFFYTYNHIGAIVLILLNLGCLFKYFKNPRWIYLFMGYVLILPLSLIRYNVAATSLILFFSFTLLADILKKDSPWKKNLLKNIGLSGGVAVLSGLIYLGLLGTVPEHAGYGEMAYWDALKQYHASLDKIFLAFKMILNFFMIQISATWINLFFWMILIFAALRLFLSSRTLYSNRNEKLNSYLALGALASLTLLNLHEYIPSAVWFRAHWVIFLLPMIAFFILDQGTLRMPTSIRAILFLTIALIPLPVIQENLAFIESCKTDQNLLHLGPTRVYLPPSQQQWIKTVTQTTAYIQQNIPPEERFITFVYTPIYYFLSNRDSPIRDLIFFNLRGPREENLLQAMNEKGINYVLLENRATHPLERHLGSLGKTYGLLFWDYLNKNFQQAAVFGPWRKNPGWVSNHSIMILKRIP